VTVGEDAVVNALAEMEVLFQREADSSLLNLTEAGPLLLLDDGFGGEIIYFRSVLRIRIHRIHIFWATRIRILPLLSKISKKNLDFYCFVTSF
jgi:hypothetical protein